MIRTEVFIRRFFNRQDYRTIADELNLSVKKTRDIYQGAKERLATALEILDTRRAIIDDTEAKFRISEKRNGKFPRSHRWFLMAKLFGMLPREIAKRDNVSASTVSSMIKRTYEQIIKGRVVLINPTPKEVTEAEERIQKALARRKGYRDANREEINAKRRKTYAEIND